MVASARARSASCSSRSFLQSGLMLHALMGQLLPEALHLCGALRCVAQRQRHPVGRCQPGSCCFQLVLRAHTGPGTRQPTGQQHHCVFEDLYQQMLPSRALASRPRQVGVGSLAYGTSKEGRHALVSKCCHMEGWTDRSCERLPAGVPTLHTPALWEPKPSIALARRPGHWKAAPYWAAATSAPAKLTWLTVSPSGLCSFVVRSFSHLKSYIITGEVVNAPEGSCRAGVLEDTRARPCSLSPKCALKAQEVKDASKSTQNSFQVACWLAKASHSCPSVLPWLPHNVCEKLLHRSGMPACSENRECLAMG